MTKIIKIEKKNSEKIEQVISDAQKRCSARTIVAEDIFIWTETVQEKLNTLLCKKDQRGVIACIDPNAQEFPSCYNGVPESTGFVIEKRASGWFLISVGRGYTAGSNHKINLVLTEAQRNAVAAYVVQYKNW